jgi:hypothetical protein
VRLAGTNPISSEKEETMFDEVPNPAPNIPEPVILVPERILNELLTRVEVLSDVVKCLREKQTAVANAS